MSECESVRVRNMGTCWVDWCLRNTGNMDKFSSMGFFGCTRTHTHTDYFAASTVQTAQNIRQKLAIWDNKHELYSLQQQKKMGCWNSFNCWQNNGRIILAHTRIGNNSRNPTNPPTHPRSIRLTWKHRTRMLTTIRKSPILNLGSQSLQSGCV